MTGLSSKDRNILGLYAARMSTASIAFMCSCSEAAIYNRLGRLQVTSVSQALDMLRADDASRKATVPKQPKPAARATPLPAPIRKVTVTRPAVTDADLGAAKPLLDRLSPSAVPALSSPAPTVSPAAAVSPAYRKGGLRLKPVTDRIARWAGHFLRARWPLQEVADLFDVAEDDLAQACEAMR